MKRKWCHLSTNTCKPHRDCRRKIRADVIRVLGGSSVNLRTLWGTNFNKKVLKLVDQIGRHECILRLEDSHTVVRDLAMAKINVCTIISDDGAWWLLEKSHSVGGRVIKVIDSNSTLRAKIAEGQHIMSVARKVLTKRLGLSSHTHVIMTGNMEIINPRVDSFPGIIDKCKIYEFACFMPKHKIRPDGCFRYRTIDGERRRLHYEWKAVYISKTPFIQSLVMDKRFARMHPVHHNRYQHHHWRSHQHHKK